MFDPVLYIYYTGSNLDSKQNKSLQLQTVRAMFFINIRNSPDTIFLFLPEVSAKSILISQGE